MSETLTSIEALTVVTDWMTLHGFPSINWAAHPEAGVRLYARTPVLDREDLRHIESISDLDALPGWLPISGNLTSKSHRNEMGPLYYQQDVNPEHTTYTLTLRQAPESGSGPWPLALIEEGHGWEVTTGVHGIEQETVAAAAWYLKGVHAGVEDPVVLITDQGLSGDMLIRGGAMYGMTQYDPSIPPSVLNWTWPDTPLIPVTRQIVNGWVGTIHTSTPHHFSEGDLILVTTWGFGPAINQPIRVSNVIDAYTVQVDLPDPAVDPPYDYNIEDIPFAQVYVRTINPSIKGGTILLDTPAKAYEPTNAAHVWLRPQRMNLLINPSFEGPHSEDNTVAIGWKSSTKLGDPSNVFSVPAEVTQGLGSLGAVASAYGSHLIIESNKFPVVENNFVGISVVLMGRGTARIGLVAWDPYYRRPIFIRLPDRQVDNAVYSSFGVIPKDGMSNEDILNESPAEVLPVLPGSVEYNLRIEWIQGEYTLEELDNGIPEGSAGFNLIRPIVDPTDGPLDYTRFFNGNTTNGLPGDYHWHGGLEHQHFSMWYNNRKNIEGRLFGGADEETGTYEKGLLSDWAPSSSAVIPHWDAIEGSPIEGWRGDYFYPVKPVHTEPVLLNPWQEYDQHLRPFYPHALTTEEGALIRDDFGEPINLVYGEPVDDILVNEFGQPITDEAGNYIVVA